MIDALVAAAGGSLVGAGGVAGLLRVRPLNRKTDIESAVVLVNAYRLLVDDLREERKTYHEENATLRERIASLETRIDTLTDTGARMRRTDSPPASG